MEKLTKIILNATYKDKYDRLQILEKDREFCGHTMEHFIDVARIAYILNLEGNLGIKKEIIYAAALLHDIGRVDEYDLGIPHHKASAKIAEEILKELKIFDENEVKDILEAIKEHRSCSGKRSVIGELLFKSDKLSRNCFSCGVSGKCNWSEDKKNNYLKV